MVYYIHNIYILSLLSPPLTPFNFLFLPRKTTLASKSPISSNLSHILRLLQNFYLPNSKSLNFHLPIADPHPSSHVCTMREAYLQKQEGIDSQQRRQRENEIERDLWQNFDLSKTQRFDPYPSNHSHVLHCLVVGIIGAKILSCCQPKMVAVKKLWGGTKMPPRRERDRDRDRKNE
jgi:hypothetical protein